MAHTMKLTLWFLLAIAVSSTFRLNAQVSSIVLKAPDTLSYSVYIDGRKHLAEHRGELRVDSLLAGNTLLDLFIQGSPITHIRAEFELDLFAPALLELRYDSEGKMHMERLDLARKHDYTLPTDAAVAHIQLEFTTLSEVSCSPPMTSFRFDRTFEEIDQFPFERDKVKRLESVLGKACLTTQQIRQLLGLIEDEERRLNLLFEARKACFNPSEFEELRDMIYLSRNRQRFDLMFGD